MHTGCTIVPTWHAVVGHVFYFPVLLSPDTTLRDKWRGFLYVPKCWVWLCLILCLHISLSQSFGGVSQEGYKLQQIGQVLQDCIISYTVWNVPFWFCSSVSHCAEGKHRKHEGCWITRCDKKLDSWNSAFVYCYMKWCILRLISSLT
jgi:hypothetical protein